MQATDFATTDGGFSAIDPPVFFSLPPMMMLAGLALLVLALLIGWWIGSERGRSNAPDPGRATDEIYEAILRASTGASTSLNNELHAKTQHLKDVIEELLGPVVVLGKGLTGALKDIDEALRGRIRVTPPAGSGPAHGAGHGGHHPAGAHGATLGDPAPHMPADSVAAEDRRGGGSTSAASAAASINHVMVIGVPITTQPPGPTAPTTPPPPPPPPPTERDMTGPEQEEALARAVRGFHNYWAKPERREDLKKAHRALSKRPPSRLLPPSHRGPSDHGSDGSSTGGPGRGWRFGD